MDNVICYVHQWEFVDPVYAVLYCLCLFLLRHALHGSLQQVTCQNDMLTQG